jgi:hypothetical protein
MAGFHAFWLAQQGNSPAEYQDAFAADVVTGRYAVADGVTQSGFARSWARLLADAFVADVAVPQAFVARLPELQSRWRERLPASLDWIAEEKAQQGAFATFLGVTMTASADNLSHEWQAVAIGDACLFHTRENRLLDVFPLERSNEFTNVPRSLGSRTAITDYWEEHAVRRCGRALPGDRLWLATDALAQWCMGECEADFPPWGEMQLLCAEEEGDACFVAWIAGLRDRSARRLRNDDLTLLMVPVVQQREAGTLGTSRNGAVENAS